MTPEHDEDAFETAFAAHFDAIWSYARRRCTSSTDADDITAEAFGVLWRRYDDLGHEVALRPWLYGVARRTLANQRRGAHRRDRLTERLAAQPASDIPDVVIARDELDPRLAEALNALDEDDREILLLRAWDRLGITEIAQVLGRTPNAVSIRLHRTRNRLIDTLGKDNEVGRTLNGWTATERTDAHD